MREASFHLPLVNWLFAPSILRRVQLKGCGLVIGGDAGVGNKGHCKTLWQKETQKQ
jgi:hypothetical protein